MVKLSFEVFSEDISLYQLTKDFADFFGFSEKDISKGKNKFFIAVPEHIQSRQGEPTNALVLYKKENCLNHYLIEFYSEFCPFYNSNKNRKDISINISK